MRIIYIQYAGDFKEAYKRLFVEDGKENYYGQKYSVSAVVDQARSGHNVMVLVLKTEGHEAQLEPNLKTIGMHGEINYRKIRKIIRNFSAARAVMRCADVKILKYC